MQLLVWGLGYVGAVSAACFAEIGHQVTGIDRDPAVVAAMQQGRSLTGEPHLNPSLAKGLHAGRLSSTLSGEHLVAETDVSLVCVGTPTDEQGRSDLRALDAVAQAIGRGLRAAGRFHTIVMRSTLPPGKIRHHFVPILEEVSRKRAGRDFGVAVNPEFMREGSAVADFLAPPYILIGEWDKRSGAVVAKLYEGIKAPIHHLAMDEAAIVKLVNNAFHSLKIAFANEIGRICDQRNMDAQRVMEIVCADTKLNISPAYLRPGFAFGGSCLPKDLRALVHAAHATDTQTPILESILPSNSLHIDAACRRVAELRFRQVAVLGFSFKAGTEDIAESPGLTLIRRLIDQGVGVRAYDANIYPFQLLPRHRAYLEGVLPHFEQILYADPEQALFEADAVLLCHDRAEYRQILGERERRGNILPILNLAGNRTKK